MRKPQHDPRPTLIPVTGRGSAADVDRVLLAGFDYHLVKRIEPQATLRLVDEAMRLSVDTAVLRTLAEDIRSMTDVHCVARQLGRALRWPHRTGRSTVISGPPWGDEARKACCHQDLAHRPDTSHRDFPHADPGHPRSKCHRAPMRCRESLEPVPANCT